MGKKVRIENCTADPRTLIAYFQSGAKAVLTLPPGGVSNPLDEEVVSILRTNKAVDQLFRGKLVRIYDDSQVVEATKTTKNVEVKAQAVEETKSKKVNKSKAKKLDLGV